MAATKRQPGTKPFKSIFRRKLVRKPKGAGHQLRQHILGRRAFTKLPRGDAQQRVCSSLFSALSAVVGLYLALTIRLRRSRDQNRRIRASQRQLQSRTARRLGALRRRRTISRLLTDMFVSWTRERRGLRERIHSPDRGRSVWTIHQIVAGSIERLPIFSRAPPRRRPFRRVFNLWALRIESPKHAGQTAPLQTARPRVPGTPPAAQVTATETKPGRKS